ncbi:hypothetical protein [Bacillus thuringiensis]|uniref:hypothetical protein n=1 Tax=Bacillus thuringiensis TaxID=1428 RepID=UPI001C450D04|nr:hypothetical protein [Bacillus thuringiensis]MBV6679498.1 hypothetical protein [Bacillus thuringiensis]
MSTLHLNKDDFFLRVASDPKEGALYYHTEGEGHWVGYLLLERGEENQPANISLTDSWQKSTLNTSYGGSYLFCSSEPTDKVEFLRKIIKEIKSLEFCRQENALRFFLWCDLTDPKNPVIKNYIQFMKNPTKVEGDISCDSEIKVNLTQLNISKRWGDTVKISLDHNNAEFTIEAHEFSFIRWIYKGSTVGKKMKKVRLRMTKEDSGALLFEKAATVNSLGLNVENKTIIQVGIRYFFFSTIEKRMKSQHFSVLKERLQQPNKPFDFEVSFNPLYPLGQVYTAFRFINLEGQEKSTIKSFFRTDFCHNISLTPQEKQTGFVLQGHAEVEDSYHFVPNGPFIMGMESNIDQANVIKHLLCGLSGTETISFKLGDVMAFHPDQCAFASAFPLKSTMEERFFNDVPNDQKWLQEEYVTAWVTIHAGSSHSINEYISQPKDATLYAKGRGVHNPSSHPLALGYDQLKIANLPMIQNPYPLVPYAKPDRQRFNHFTYQEITDFERYVILPTRKKQIIDNEQPTLRDERFPCIEGTNVRKTTTPQGLLVDVDDNQNWHKLLLARIQRGINEELSFNCVIGKLKEAFLTPNLFLVITNNLSDYVRNFDNTISITGWPFVINNGSDKDSYGDYSNIIIFKFCKGKMRDLVETPLQWTNADDFNNTEKEELFAVSAWLREYLDSAQKEDDEFFKDFNKIVNDPNWYGILILKVDMATKELPEQLKGLLAGMNGDLFKAHHLGINVNYVAEPGPSMTEEDGEIGIQEDSSMFGLINYIEPAYEQRGMNNKAIPAYSKEYYDFKVLSLRVLFKNSQIQNFTSLVQLTVAKLFEETVSCVTSINKPDDSSDDQNCEPTITSILFNGTYENREGVPSYQFRTSSANYCYLKSNILHYIEIVAAEFQSQKIRDGVIQAKFLLSGYMNFQEIKGVDIFSFGSIPDNVDRTQMLPFTNLVLHMEYDETLKKRSEIQYDSSTIQFHLEGNKPRPHSLCHGFPLKFKRLISGRDEADHPDKLGYLQVQIQLKNYDSDNMIPEYINEFAKGWTGFEFELDLGSGGLLAKDSDFISYILLAWSATTVPIEPKMSIDQVVPRYNIYLGIRLPGGGEKSKLFNLQEVLQLSIDDIQLLCDVTDPKKPVFSLQFTNLALQFLNMKFPPSGTTNFLLFGNPDLSSSNQEVGWFAEYTKKNGNNCEEG